MRYAVHDPADVEVESGPHLSALVLDVSKSGLCLELDTPVARGAQVTVVFSTKLVVVGEVRYCHRASSRYHAGILIRDASPSH